MPNGASRLPDNIRGFPLHALLVPVPATCFLGALLTDIAYSRSLNLQWANFSSWLLAAGAITITIATLAGLVEILAARHIHDVRMAWIHGAGNALVLALAVFNALVHSRDGYTGVVPAGLALSALTVLVLVAVSWTGWTLAYRRAAAAPREEP